MAAENKRFRKVSTDATEEHSFEKLSEHRAVYNKEATYSIADAGRILKRSEHRILQMVSTGELEAIKDDQGQWVIPQHALYQLIPKQNENHIDSQMDEEVSSSLSVSQLVVGIRYLERKLGSTEVRAELAEKAEKTLREQLQRSQERIEHLEAERDKLLKDLLPQRDLTAAERDRAEHFEDELRAAIETRRGWLKRLLRFKALMLPTAIGAAIFFLALTTGIGSTILEQVSNFLGQGRQGSSLREEISNPALSYTRVESADGGISVEVPTGWEVRTGTEGSLTASPNLSAWKNIPGNATIEPGASGVYVMGAKEMGQTYTNDQIIDMANKSESCQPSTRQNLYRAPYSETTQTESCGGSTFTTMAATPEGGECAVMVHAVASSETDEKAAQHILDTFDVNCEKMPQEMAM